MTKSRFFDVSSAFERLFPLLLAALIAASAVAAPSMAGAAGWEVVGNTDNVKVSRKQVEGSSKLAFRGETIAKVHIGRIVNVFADFTQRRFWVDRWKEDRELENRGPLERIFWIRFGLPFPVSDRDYILHVKAEPNEAARTVTARINSVTHRKKGEDDCCVRGLVVSTYYRFEALAGERTKLTVEVHTDPRGMLPSWVVNLIQKKWPVKTLNGLVAAALRPTITVRPEYQSWHEPRVVPPPPPAVPVEPVPAPVAPAAPAPAPAVVPAG
jgi:hypothetical protein